MKEALEARQDMLEAQEEFGSSVTIRQYTEEVRDPLTYEVITPESKIDTNIKAFIKTSATDKILSKLTDNERQSYSLYMKFYVDLELNKEDFKIIFDGDEYSINYIEESILQDLIWRYEVLIKK